MKIESQGFPLPSVHIMHILQNSFTIKKSESYMDWKLLIMVKTHTSYLEMTAIKKCEGMFKSRSPEWDKGRVLKHSRFDVLMVDLGV